MDLFLPRNSFHGRKSLLLMVVVTRQNVDWLATGPSAAAHKHRTGCQVWSNRCFGDKQEKGNVLKSLLLGNHDAKV